jgi:hypothetical protein
VTATLISEEMRAAVGRELGTRVSHPVSESDIRRWVIAVYWPTAPPSRAVDPVDRRLCAPEDFNPFAWSTAFSTRSPAAQTTELSHGIEETLGVAGPSLPFILNGGMDTTYGVPIRPGDVITSVNRLVGYEERAGRLGQMLLTVTEDAWSNQSGEGVKTVRVTTIRYEEHR